MEVLSLRMIRLNALDDKRQGFEQVINMIKKRASEHFDIAIKKKHSIMSPKAYASDWSKSPDE